MTTLTAEEQLANVANAVKRVTAVTREHNGRGRNKTYAGNIDDIASASRQLAEMVEMYLDGQLHSVQVGDNPF